MNEGFGRKSDSLVEVDHNDESGPDPHGAFVFSAPSSDSPGSAFYGQASRTRDSLTRAPHRQRPSKLSINAFPHVEFGVPASSSTINPTPSPTRSPVRLTPPILLSSHKRGGSEFVGGAITGGGPVLVNTSPHSNEEGPVMPPSPPKGLPAGRRGHAHKRSGAVSQSDINLVLQSSPDNRAGSAPSTPSDPQFRAPRPPAPERANSQPGGCNDRDQMSKSASPTRPQTGNSQSRSRVGFSDVIEFIPRPLSTISSETSSSMSTIRPGHSVTDSLGSTISGGTSSPPSKYANAVVRCRNSEDQSERHGSDGSLESDYFTGVNVVNTGTSDHTLAPVNVRVDDLHRVVQKSGSTAAANLSIENPQQMETSAVPQESHDIHQPAEDSDSGDKYQRLHRPATSQCARPRTSPELKAGKHRVKSWAGSILHRMERRPAETDEPLGSAHLTTAHAIDPDQDFTVDNMGFDNDTTYIIEEPVSKSARPFNAQTTMSSQYLTNTTSNSDVNVPSPMIDLDAALGFSSPLPGSTADDASAKHAATKRRLHSSRDMGMFTGPAMNYHRRTESAPEMEHFDRAGCDFSRLGSNAQIDDAIEEEEEDVDQETARDDQQILGLGVQIVESEMASEQHVQRRSSNRPSPNENERSVIGIATPPTHASFDPVEIVDGEDEPRFSVLTKSSDESTITPTLSVDPASQFPKCASLDSALPTPSLTYGTTPETPSAVSSAAYTKTSFDGQDLPRTHTASSSITDRLTLDSSKVGNPSAASVDDVPSLTSSASTMFSNHPTRFSSSGNTTSSAERSTSLSAAVPSRARPGTASKRSSLASLSRLVGGSYNRSRLNIEETMPPDNPEKTEKKKRRRVSRMMTFWKSKGKPPAS